MNEDLTYPHDYRIVAASDLQPVIVGGQAVNLWAITYLEGADMPSTNWSSGDMDLLHSSAIIELLSKLSGWKFESVDFRKLADPRVAVAEGKSPDGRKLVIEVLRMVKGLSPNDLTHTEEVMYAGSVYRVLDPFTVLKAKAANIREIPQDGPRPRSDRRHLEIVARCAPLYLIDLEQAALRDPSQERKAFEAVRRALVILADFKTAETLRQCGIEPADLMPQSFAESSIAKIRNAYVHQVPRLRADDPAPLPQTPLPRKQPKL